MLDSFLVLEPTTPKGKYGIVQCGLLGKYRLIAECRSESVALRVRDALRNEAFNAALVNSFDQKNKKGKK
jgi:hypothetical protein